MSSSLFASRGAVAERMRYAAMRGDLEGVQILYTSYGTHDANPAGWFARFAARVCGDRLSASTTSNIVNVRDQDNCTPLHNASMLGKLNVVKYLFEVASADIGAVDVDGYTPLHHACKYGQLEIVRYLVDKRDADIYAQDNNGRTPLHHACMKGYLDIIKYMVDMYDTDSRGNTPLHFASHGWGTLHVVRHLVEESGADIHAVNKEGDTPLHLASRWWHTVKVVQYLVERCGGASIILAVNTAGQTPLHIACQHRITNVVVYLVSLLPATQ
jgi:ankyrin repeat protein